MSAPPKYRLVSDEKHASRRKRKPLRTLDKIFDPKLAAARQALWRARSGVEVGWECVRCKSHYTEWFSNEQQVHRKVNGKTELVFVPVLASTDPAHTCQRSFYCPTCDLAQTGIVTKAWRERAEERRPYSKWAVGLWDFDKNPFKPQNPDIPRPAPVRPRAIEKEVTMDLIRYFLSDRRGDDLVGLLARSCTVPDPGWVEGAEADGGDLLIPFPEQPHLQILLLALLPSVAEEHAVTPYEPGHPISIPGARKAFDAGCWWPAEAPTLTVEQRATAERIHREVVEEQRNPTPDIPTESVAVPNPNPPAVIDPLDEVIAAYQEQQKPSPRLAGLHDVLGDSADDLDPEAYLHELRGKDDTDTEVEWVDDDETHPGVIVDGEE